MKWLRNLYDWCIAQAEKPYAELALFVIAFMESSFFPIPPDVLLIAMVLARRDRWLKYFGICLAGSVLGGMAGYAIGHGLWLAVDQYFIGHVFSQETFDKVQGLYQKYDFGIVFVAAFTPIPYKVFTIAAGVAEINFGGFVLASVFGRGGRFVLVAGLLRWKGEPMRAWLEKNLEWATFALAAVAIAGFLILKKIPH